MRSLAARKAGATDRDFVRAAWVNGFRFSKFRGPIADNLYYPTYFASIDQLLQRSQVESWVAFNPKEQDPRYELYGFVVIERGRRGDEFHARCHIDGEIPVVHFAFTKKSFRRLRSRDVADVGIMTYLLQAAGLEFKGDRCQPLIYTHGTPDAFAAAKSVPFGRAIHDERYATRAIEEELERGQAYEVVPASQP